MDPLNKLHLESDSSLILAKEAQNRNHKIFIYEPKDLTLSGNQLFANASSLKIEKKNKPQSKEFCPIYCGTIFLDNCKMLESLKSIK